LKNKGLPPESQPASKYKPPGRNWMSSRETLFAGAVPDANWRLPAESKTLKFRSDRVRFSICKKSFAGLGWILTASDSGSSVQQIPTLLRAYFDFEV
jgi:hypothetical protein